MCLTELPEIPIVLVWFNFKKTSLPQKDIPKSLFALTLHTEVMGGVFPLNIHRHSS